MGSITAISWIVILALSKLPDMVVFMSYALLWYR